MLKSFIGSIVHPSTAEIQCFISAVAEETDHNGLYGERRLGGDIHHDLPPCHDTDPTLKVTPPSRTPPLKTLFPRISYTPQRLLCHLSLLPTHTAVQKATQQHAGFPTSARPPQTLLLLQTRLHSVCSSHPRPQTVPLQEHRYWHLYHELRHRCLRIHPASRRPGAIRRRRRAFWPTAQDTECCCQRESVVSVQA